MKKKLSTEDLKILLANTCIKLDCGHQATPGQNFTNTIIILSLGGGKIETSCAQCGY